MSDKIVLNSQRKAYTEFRLLRMPLENLLEFVLATILANEGGEHPRSFNDTNRTEDHLRERTPMRPGVRNLIDSRGADVNSWVSDLHLSWLALKPSTRDSHAKPRLSLAQP